MAAEILTIGTELLLGDVVDTNTPTIAAALRRIGVDVFRTSTVGDNIGRIAEAIREGLARSEAVITTGGLGPTVDDPTRQAAAEALGVGLEFYPDLWDDIQERFARFGRTPTENNRRQAHLPQGARPIRNPVGTAPGFVVEHGASSLIALPGVPAEMRWMLDHEVISYLLARQRSPTILVARLLRAAGVGESWVDERIQDLEALPHPTVGVLAHPGRIDIRIAAKAATPEEAATAIAPVEAEVRRRLGEAIYGADGDSLEGVVAAAIEARGWKLATIELGSRGGLAAALDGAPAWRGGLVFAADEQSPSEETIRQWIDRAGAEACLVLEIRHEGSKALIRVRWCSPDGIFPWQGSYGGPPENASAWGVSAALDLVRRRLARRGLV